MKLAAAPPLVLRLLIPLCVWLAGVKVPALSWAPSMAELVPWKTLLMWAGPPPLVNWSVLPAAGMPLVEAEETTWSWVPAGTPGAISPGAEPSGSIRRILPSRFPRFWEFPWGSAWGQPSPVEAYR